MQTAAVIAAFLLMGFGFGKGSWLGALTGLVAAIGIGSGLAIAVAEKGTNLSGIVRVRVAQMAGGVIAAAGTAVGAYYGGWRFGWLWSIPGYASGMLVAVFGALAARRATVKNSPNVPLAPGEEDSTPPVSTAEASPTPLPAPLGTSWLEVAERSLYRREYDDALAAFSRAIEQQPREWRAWVGAGQAASYLDRISEAGQYIQRAVQLGPLDPTVLAACAHILERSGDPKHAKKQMARALDLDPDLAEGYNLLADWQRNAGELRKALGNYDAGVKALARRLVKRMRNDAANPIVKHDYMSGTVWMECAMFGALWLATEAGLKSVAWPTNDTAIHEERTEAHRGYYFVDEQNDGKVVRVYLPNYFASFRLWLSDEPIFEFLVRNQGTVHQQLGELEVAEQRFSEAAAFSRRSG